MRAEIVPYGLVWLTLAIAVTIFWVTRDGSIDPSVGPWRLAGSAAAVAALLVQRRHVNGRWLLEPPVLVAVVLFVWHFAFWAVYYAGLASVYRVAQYLNFAPAGTGSAFLACFVAVLATCAGIQIGLAGRRWQSGFALREPGRAVYAVSALGVALVMIYFVVRGRGLVGAYADVFTDGDPMRRLYNLGIVLVLGATAPVLLGEPSQKRRLLFLLCALLPTLAVSTLLGSRWVLFSAVLLGLAAQGMRSQRGGLLRWIVLGVVLIAIGTVVKEARAGNIDSPGQVPAALFDRYTNPFIEFPEEMGQTFLPVAGVISDNPERLHGASLAGALSTAIPCRRRDFRCNHPAAQSRVRGVAFPRAISPRGLHDRLFGGCGACIRFRSDGVLVGMVLLGRLLGLLYRRAIETGSSTWLRPVGHRSLRHVRRTQ